MQEKEDLKDVQLKGAGQVMLDWQGEKRSYEDFEKMHPTKVRQLPMFNMFNIKKDILSHN